MTEVRPEEADGSVGVMAGEGRVAAFPELGQEEPFDHDGEGGGRAAHGSEPADVGRAALKADGPTVRATGQLKADVVQSCAVSGEDLPVKIAEPIALHFVPPADSPESEEEIELEAEDLDEIEMEGTRFDLGEAVAQSLALAIDPYLEGPGAEEVRKAGLLGQGEGSPFAALKGLIKE